MEHVGVGDDKDDNDDDDEDGESNAAAGNQSLDPHLESLLMSGAELNVSPVYSSYQRIEGDVTRVHL